MVRKIIFEGKNCRLGLLNKEDLKLIKDWRNQQREILRQNKILTNSDQKKWFFLLKKDKQQKIFSILNSDNNLLGYCGITHIDWSNKRGEVSFLLKTGTPYIFYKKVFLEVLKFLKRYSFSNLGLHKLFAETFDFRKNHESILREAGFKYEATLVDHILKK